MQLHLSTLLMLLFVSNCLFAQVSTSPPLTDSAGRTDKIFTKIEIDAIYPGGENAWRSFISRNLKTSVAAGNGAPIGKYTVVIKFIISKGGYISDIKPETNLGYGMEEEAINVIKKSATWVPAIQNGKTVNAYRRQPVTFIVKADDFNISSSPEFTLLIGTDNELNVAVSKVKNTKIKLTISQGIIITKDGNKFFAHVTEPGRVIITAYLKRNNKMLGKASFEVR